MATPGYTAHFETVIEHCPTSSEENQCVGRLAIYAYLKATVDVVTNYSMNPTTGQAVPTTQQQTKRILPQKATIPFSVDFPETPQLSSPEVDTCMTPIGSHGGSQPVEVRDAALAGFVLTRKFVRPSLPVISPYEESGDKVIGKVSFSWSHARFFIGAGGAISATGPNPVPLGSNVNHHVTVNTATGVGGGTIPLEVAFEISYTDGCVKKIIPDPDTATDAKTVYTAGGDSF